MNLNSKRVMLLAGAQAGSKPSPASCCSNIDGKPLRQLNLAETLEWLQCNQIAPDSIDIVKREKVVGYEMSVSEYGRDFLFR